MSVCSNFFRRVKGPYYHPELGETRVQNVLITLDLIVNVIGQEISTNETSP